MRSCHAGREVQSHDGSDGPANAGAHIVNCVGCRADCEPVNAHKEIPHSHAAAARRRAVRCEARDGVAAGARELFDKGARSAHFLAACLPVLDAQRAH